MSAVLDKIYMYVKMVLTVVLKYAFVKNRQLILGNRISNS